MKGYSFVITMGLGAAVGAVAVLMMPRQNPARRLADKAAANVEDAVCQAASKSLSKNPSGEPSTREGSPGILDCLPRRQIAASSVALTLSVKIQHMLEHCLNECEIGPVEIPVAPELLDQEACIGQAVQVAKDRARIQPQLGR